MASFDIAALNPSIEEGLWLNVPEVLATRFLLFNQGVLIRQEALSRIGGFDESLWLLEDHELALRLSLAGPWAFIREPLVNWRESKSSLYQSACKNEIRPAESLVRILECHLDRVKDRSEYQRLRGYLEHELDTARRRLKIETMAQSPSCAVSVVTSVLRKLEQYRRSLYIRSRSFPGMKIEPITAEYTQ